MGELIKYRHEFKYLLSEIERVILENRTSVLMPRDKYIGDATSYSVRSLYFDDYNNSCFYNTENGTNPRIKYRIRTYNCSQKNMRLEIKNKNGEKNHKEQCPLSEHIFEGILNGILIMNDYELKDNVVWKKFILQYMSVNLKPVVIVDYDRTPYVYDAGNVRVTFDSNISSSVDYGHFFDVDMVKRLVMPKGKCLMEVKFDDFMPDFLYQALSLEKLQRTSFSKYYMCRKCHL